MIFKVTSKTGNVKYLQPASAKSAEEFERRLRHLAHINKIRKVEKIEPVKTKLDDLMKK